MNHVNSKCVCFLYNCEIASEIQPNKLHESLTYFFAYKDDAMILILFYLIFEALLSLAVAFKKIQYAQTHSMWN